jgi:DNA helicase HerA-like ATPase
MTHLTIGPGAAIPLRYANRHALIAGATGTGKTETLKRLAAEYRRAGVPVLIIDAKGDLDSFGDSVWDCFAGQPLDLYTLGPDLIARALQLSEAQSGALYVLFSFAETEGIPLATLADLKALCGLAAQDLRAVSVAYGLVSRASLAALQRAALRLDRDGGPAFGRPGLDLAKLGQGVTVLRAARLARSPALYAAAVSHILLNLYRRAPELGDTPKPRLALMIDESHLVFSDAPPALIRRLESVVRLIRSKGVALTFATQSPGDLPAAVSGQLATRIQHGLRGTTPGQAKAIRAAAETMPQAAGFDAMGAIMGLGVGEALVSVPGPGGVPGNCQRVKVTFG